MNQQPPSIEAHVHFELTTAPGSLVFVAGTFNNWNPTANPLRDNPDSGHYKATVRVPKGTHEYKFVVNGAYIMDPKCLDWALGGFGFLNSVIRVG